MTISDVQACGYETIPAFTIGGVQVYAVSGFGVTIYAAENDAETLESIADPAADCERKFQWSFPDAAKARVRLVDNGYTVTRPDATVDRFTVYGGAVNLTGLSGSDLVSEAGSLPPLT